MSGTKLPTRSPRAERSVAAILEGIPSESRDDIVKAAALTLEHLVSATAALNDFKRVIADGLESRDPVKLLAAVQIYRDRMAGMLGAKDEYLEKTLSNRQDQVVAGIVDRLSSGEFRVQCDTGNYFQNSFMYRALAGQLREVATDVLAQTPEGDHEVDVRSSIDEVMRSDETSPSAPKI